MPTAQLVNLNHGGWPDGDNCFYIGRSKKRESPLGNPFTLGKDGDRLSTNYGDPKPWLTQANLISDEKLSIGKRSKVVSLPLMTNMFLLITPIRGEALRPHAKTLNGSEPYRQLWRLLMQVNLISVTKPVDDLMSPEGLIAYCARVSSSNQDNPNYVGLLKYCIKERHWSIFEMADMTVEITTTREIAPQLLRHKSFAFQEFSLRYAPAMGYEAYDARRQDDKNRQNSFDDLDTATKEWFLDAQDDVWNYSYDRYQTAIAKGIAKESARSMLPMNTVTRLYMKGSVRSWIHYLQVRCHPSTQKEHREIALAISEIFASQFPAVDDAMQELQF